MTFSPRHLLISALLALLPLSAQAQSGVAASSSSPAPVQAPQTSGFGSRGASPSAGSTDQGSLQSPSLGNRAQQPGFSRGQAGTTLTPAEARAAGQQAGGSAQEQALRNNQTQSEEPGLGTLQRAEQNEFQDFIAQSTGRVLPLFGLNLFTNTPSTFAPVENIPVTPDYVIGPGDEIVIRVWGQIDGEYRLAVDRNGTINIPKVGTVSISGTKMQDLQGYVRSAIARNFRNFELNVSLGQLRSIQIFVVGQARRPGSYTVSSLSTLVNALFASGGPSATGSMRRIQLKRGDKTASEFDVYDFLAKGDKSKDVRLLPGDVIFIPPQGQLVAISGSVKVPAIYELKTTTHDPRPTTHDPRPTTHDPRTTLNDLIDLAGGLTTTASGQKVLLERIYQRKVRRVDEFSLDQAGLARAVKDGDLVSVLPISPKFDNAVTLRGNVAAPLRYPYRDGMRISDLIPEKDALIVSDYYTRKNLVTRTDLQGVLIAGANQQGSTVTPTDGQAANQLLAEVRRSSAEINWDYALIERLNPADLSPMLLPFNLGKAVLERDPAQNLLLKPGDVVTVFSKDDFGVPLARRTNLIVLEDEFKNPGVYKAEPGETLRQLVVRTGGVTPDAYFFGAVFTRESTRIAQQKNLDEAINRLETDLQRSVAKKAQSGLDSDTEGLAQQTSAQQALLGRLRQLRATGRIILKPSADAQLRDIPDLPLENGDRLRIPARPAIVSVIGSVYNEGSFVYKPDQRVADYLAQAGGPTRAADAGAVYVLRADGSVISKRQSGWMMSSFDSERLMPGDAIVVPEDFEHTTWTKTLKDWGQILYQFGLGAAAIKVLKD
jgi:protein involved in polysaccharide export with SLBB domain